VKETPLPLGIFAWPRYFGFFQTPAGGGGSQLSSSRTLDRSTDSFALALSSLGSLRSLGSLGSLGLAIVSLAPLISQGLKLVSTARAKKGRLPQSDPFPWIPKLRIFWLLASLDYKEPPFPLAILSHSSAKRRKHSSSGHEVEHEPSKLDALLIRGFIQFPTNPLRQPSSSQTGSNLPVRHLEVRALKSSYFILLLSTRLSARWYSTLRPRPTIALPYYLLSEAPL